MPCYTLTSVLRYVVDKDSELSGLSAPDCDSSQGFHAHTWLSAAASDKALSRAATYPEVSARSGAGLDSLRLITACTAQPAIRVATLALC